MLNWLKLLQHKDHSGHLRPHEHTSYLPLLLILLVVGLLLTTFTTYAQSPGPEAGSIGLTGTVPGTPPAVAATITTPTDQKHFTLSPIVISGSCPKNTLVEIFKNDIFAGSSACTDAGVYSLDVDLIIGKNALKAIVYDALNQPGPDSNIVTVYYDILPTQSSLLTPLSFGGAQLVLNTDAVFRGAFPNQDLTVPIDIIGGSAPYAVNIQWGDSTNRVVPRNDNLSFNSAHAYSKPGTYQISLQATDSLGRVGFLTVAAIINGQPATGVAATAPGSSETTSKLLALWPLYTSSVAVVVSFWLGEKREKSILTKRGLAGPVYVKS